MSKFIISITFRWRFINLAKLEAQQRNQFIQQPPVNNLLNCKNRNLQNEYCIDGFLLGQVND